MFWVLGRHLSNDSFMICFREGGGDLPLLSFSQMPGHHGLREPGSPTIVCKQASPVSPECVHMQEDGDLQRHGGPLAQPVCYILYSWQA